MNTSNNGRRKESQEKIERIFVELIQEKNLNEISVTDICKKANLNRSTFYANYLDVYDLADKIKERLEHDVTNLYLDEELNQYNSNNFSKIFRLVKENPLFFKTYFKLEFDSTDTFKQDYRYDTNQAKEFYNDEYIDYHIAFFKAGFNAILKKWLYEGCVEPIEDMCKIISSEYNNKEK